LAQEEKGMSKTKTRRASRKTFAFRGPLRTAVILGAILLGLGGLATWDEWQTEQDEKLDKEKNRIASFELAQIKSVILTIADREEDPPKVTELSLAKAEGSWRVISPINALADQAAVDNFLKTVIDYAYKREVTSEGQQNAYGVTEPSRIVDIKYGNEKSWTLTVGNKAPVGYDVYLTTSESSKVYLGGQHLLMATNKNLFEFRDKALLSIDEEKIKTFTYNGTEKVVLERNAQGFGISYPTPLKADVSALKDFIADLNAAKVTEFIDSPQAADLVIFRKPVTVTWETESGEVSQMVFAKNDKQVFAAFNPKERIFQIGDGFKFSKTLMDFRDRRIFSFDAADLSDVTIDDAKFKNVKGAWYSEEDAALFGENGELIAKDKEPKPAEKHHVRALLVDLEFAKTHSYIDRKGKSAASLSVPIHAIELTFSPEKNQKTIGLKAFEIPGDEENLLVDISSAEFLYKVEKRTLVSAVETDRTGDAEELEDLSSVDEDSLDDKINF
jgi:hypothetical protein